MGAPTVAFLLGVPRSGTTLLAELLSAHPEIVAPPEPWLLLALESLGKTSSRHPADSQLLSIAIDELFSRIDRHRSLRALADDVYAQYLRESKTTCLVDKTPRYWLILDFLETLYPEASTIVLLRNPYAIAASLKKTWGIQICLDGADARQAPYIADLALGLEAVARHAERHGSLIIRYETLVRSPASEQARTLIYLGHQPNLLTEPGVPLDAHRAEQTSFGDTNIRTRRRVDTSSLHNWQAQLSVAEVQAVTDLVGPDLIKRLGYGDALESAIRLGATMPTSTNAAEHRHSWRQWLANNRAVVAQAASWPAPQNEDVGQRIQQMEEQWARDREWALNSERLLHECNDDRRELRAWAEDAERRVTQLKAEATGSPGSTPTASRQLKRLSRERDQLQVQLNDARERMKDLEKQVASDRAWALQSECLLQECNHDRQKLREWVEDAERRASKHDAC
jgi:hypothetical protein